MVTYHGACFVVMFCQVVSVIGDFESLKFLAIPGDPSTLGEFNRYFVWPGYQSGPNERKVEMWAFGHTKQSIILRNPFLGIYVGGHGARAWEEEQGMPIRLGQRFLFSL